jgi:hypothetical protein
LLEIGSINLCEFTKNDPVNFCDPFGFQCAGLGVERPANQAVGPNGLNPAIDPGHTFGYLISPSGSSTSVFSFGPGHPIGAMNKNEFLGGHLSGNAHWPLHGPATVLQWPITPQQYSNGINYLTNFQLHTPNYTPSNQCSSAALDFLRNGVGLTNIPSGVGPVVVPPTTALGISINGGYSNQLPNPLSLFNSMTGGVSVPTTIFPHP